MYNLAFEFDLSLCLWDLLMDDDQTGEAYVCLRTMIVEYIPTNELLSDCSWCVCVCVLLERDAWLVAHVNIISLNMHLETAQGVFSPPLSQSWVGSDLSLILSVLKPVMIILHRL